MIMVLTFVQKENCYGCFTSSKMDRFVLLERFSWSTSQAARPCKMQGSVRWNRDSEDRHLRLPSHGGAKGEGRPPSIAKPSGRPLHTNWALNEASFRSRDAPRHGFVFEGMTWRPRQCSTDRFRTEGGLWRARCKIKIAGCKAGQSQL
jgi:hypothetical protein